MRGKRAIVANRPRRRESDGKANKLTAQNDAMMASMLGHSSTISTAQSTIPPNVADSYLTLLETTRRTLVEIEEKEKLAPNDPALQELKRSVVLMIADLEVRLHKFKAA
jgi:hypothetical protein